MRKFVDIIFYMGFLFFGGGFLIALGQLILYNGIGNIFEYMPSDKSHIEVKMDMMPNQLVYRYFVENVEYAGSQNVSSTVASKIDLDSTTILYNKYFKNLSMVDGITGRSSKAWDQITGMFIMGFFFMFMLLIYKFSDIDKWIGIYTKGEYKSSK